MTPGETRNWTWPYYFEITANPSLTGGGLSDNLYFDLSLAPATFWNNVDADGSDIRMLDMAAISDLDRQMPMSLSSFSRVGRTGIITFRHSHWSNRKFIVLCGNTGIGVAGAPAKYQSAILTSVPPVLPSGTMLTKTFSDSYSESNRNTDSNLFVSGGGSTGSAIGQSFKCTANCFLMDATFYLGIVGNPKGNMASALYAHSGVFGTSSLPTGDPLALSNPIDISGLSTLNQALITFTFNPSISYLMAANTNFVIAILYSDPSSTTNNRLKVGINTNSPTHPGNRSRLDGTWTAQFTQDTCFYVNGGVATAEYNNLNNPAFWTVSELRRNSKYVPTL